MTVSERPPVLRDISSPLLEAARLAVITDPHRARGRGLHEQVRAAVAGGAAMVLARWPGVSEDIYAGLLRRVRPLVPPGVLFGVYDHPQLAVELGALVQLGKDDAPVNEVREQHPNLLIGYSAHALTEATQAARDGADFCLLSLLFPTTKDGGQRKPLDEDVWTNAYEAGVPIFALGGVTMDNLPRARDMGVRRVAVSSGVVAADNPVQTVRAMTALLAPARKRKKRGRRAAV